MELTSVAAGDRIRRCLGMKVRRGRGSRFLKLCQIKTSVLECACGMSAQEGWAGCTDSYSPVASVWRRQHCGIPMTTAAAGEWGGVKEGRTDGNWVYGAKRGLTALGSGPSGPPPRRGAFTRSAWVLTRRAASLIRLPALFMLSIFCSHAELNRG